MVEQSDLRSPTAWSDYFEDIGSRPQSGHDPSQSRALAIWRKSGDQSFPVEKNADVSE
jgi:hypothetical protein